MNGIRKKMFVATRQMLSLLLHLILATVILLFQLNWKTFFRRQKVSWGFSNNAKPGKVLRFQSVGYLLFFLHA